VLVVGSRAHVVVFEVAFNADEFAQAPGGGDKVRAQLVP